MQALQSESEKREKALRVKLDAAVEQMVAGFEHLAKAARQAADCAELGSGTEKSGTTSRNRLLLNGYLYLDF